MEHLLGVEPLLGLGENAVGIAIDRSQDDGSNRDAGAEAHFDLDAIFLKRDGRGLEVLVETMAMGLAGDHGESENQRCCVAFHFEFGLRP